MILLLMLSGVQACSPNHTGISLAKDWIADLVSENGDQMPDMMVISPDHRYLYQSLETSENLLSPSLARIDLRTGKRDLLIHGMARADGLRMAPDGSLWLGEEWQDGLVWRIESPDRLPPGQRVDRQRLKSSHASIQPVLAAGRFAHEGLAFSADGRYLYLADEWEEGCLYRYGLSSGILRVLHGKQGWLTVKRPHAARFESEKLHGRMFLRIEDMERLPDGRILMSETGNAESQGKILALNDGYSGPEVGVYLKHERLRHPDNLEWDSVRSWLWITDDSDPSILWVWDGKNLREIARHDSAEITGVESASDGSVYINLQHRRFAQDLTLRLKRK